MKKFVHEKVKIGKVIWLILALILIKPAITKAGPGNTPSSDSASDKTGESKSDLYELDDPTIIKSRIGLENIYSNLSNGAARYKASIEGVYGHRISNSIDFGLRLRVPIAHYFASDMLGDSDVTGLGDIEFAFGPAFRLRENLRTFFGLETQFNSASDDRLGDNSIILRPLYTLAWNINSFIDAVINFEYSDSVFEEKGTGETQSLLIATPITFALPKTWSLTFEWRGKAIFVSPEQFQDSIRLGVAKGFKKVPITIFSKFEIPINDTNFEARFGFFYYFN